MSELPMTRPGWARLLVLPLTLAIWLAGVACGLAMGFVIGAVRFFGPAALTWPLATPVEAARGMPFLVQCFLLNVGGPFIGIGLTSILAG